jgi:organic hydroperoxide reductase OsmC/OhrA
MASSHTYTATILWQRGAQSFTDNRYSRGHTWAFDGGTVVPASSAPSSVRVPLSREDAVDPEEALVASVSSCHMLFFLSFAAREGFVVDRYEDAASGVMMPNAAGKLFVSSVTLAPRITFSGPKRPAAADIARLHERSHEECYIANSIKAEVVVTAIEPVFA